jgi:hypothetical protein
MTRMRLGVALGLLVLATASCGRYGPPVRAPRPAAAPVPAPAAQIPPDPASNQPIDETVEP